MIRSALCFLFLLLLSGCATAPHPASVANGTCKVFEAPQYAVKGKKQYDQDWIDSTVEGGVGACGWQRPAARPAEMPPVAKAKAKPAAPKKHKPKWLQFLHGLRGSVPATPASAAEAPAPAAAPEPAAEPAPPPAPKRPIDQLLGGH